MRFGKREIRAINIKLHNPREILVDSFASDSKLLFVYAHVDSETGSQLFGISSVDKTTGEIVTKDINLSRDVTYSVDIVEILAIEE